MRRLLTIVILSITLLIAGLCASVLIVGLYLSSPVSEVVGRPPSALAAAKSVQISSQSGSTLQGWWLSDRQTCHRVVILMHGVRSNRLSMVKRAEGLHAKGFSVLLFDFQGHGESSGQRITYGARESLDAAAAVNFVRVSQQCERVAAIGVSLGGAAALLGSQPLNVDALLLESVYPDIDSALSNRLHIGLGPYLSPLFTPVLMPAFKLLLPPILGVKPDQLRPIDHIETAGVPLLVSSGTDDKHTTIIESQALFERASEPKQFRAVQGAAHVDLENYAPDDYWNIVLLFLSEYLDVDYTFNSGVPRSVP